MDALLELSADDVREDLKLHVRVRAEAGAGRNPVLIDDTEGAKQ